MEVENVFQDLRLKSQIMPLEIEELAKLSLFMENEYQVKIQQVKQSTDFIFKGFEFLDRFSHKIEMEQLKKKWNLLCLPGLMINQLMNSQQLIMEQRTLLLNEMVADQALFKKKIRTLSIFQLKRKGNRRVPEQ